MNRIDYNGTSGAATTDHVTTRRPDGVLPRKLGRHVMNQKTDMTGHRLVERHGTNQWRSLELLEQHRVYKPSKGLFRLLKYDQGRLPGI